MLGLFEAGARVANSPAQLTRYEGRARRAFLISALRTRSLFSREELARIIGPFTLSELFSKVFDREPSESELVPGSHRPDIAMIVSLPPLLWFLRRVFRFGLRAVRFVLRRSWRFGLRAVRFVLRRIHRLVRLPLRFAETFVGLMTGALDISQTTASFWGKVLPLRKYRLGPLARPIIWLLGPIDHGILWLILKLTPRDQREEQAEAGLTLASFADQLQQQADTESEVPASATSPGLENAAHLNSFRAGPVKRFFLQGRVRKHLRTSKTAILDLAWLYSNQGIFQDDLQRAWQLYGWYQRRYSLKQFSHMHLVDYALLAARLGHKVDALKAANLAKSALDLLQRLAPRKMPTTAALGIQHSLDRSYRFNLELSIQPQFLRADMANPLRRAADPLDFIRNRRSEVEQWLLRLSKAIIPGDVAPLGLGQQPERSLLDSLTASHRLNKVTEGPKVTVVMSAFQPDDSILSAVRSVLESSYQNLELIVIDDCSGPTYAALLQQLVEMDTRVKLLHQTENGGTYRIRNRALDEASGDLITFHDSDDWMHPQRLEKQISQLVKSKKIANISMSTRLTQNLEAAESIRRLRIGLCEPSLLFWRQQALEKVGYFDTVRKGGDAEYRRRLERAFHQDLDVVDPFRCLTLQRADNGGLTQGDLGFRWIVDFRLTYRDSFSHFHKTSESLAVANSEQRAFYAPRPMRVPRSLDTGVRSFDLVIAANAHDPLNAKQLQQLAEGAAAAGKTVGYWQLNSPYPYSNPKTTRASILNLLNSGALESVYPSDQLEIQELKVIAPSSLLGSHRPMDFRWRVHSRTCVSLAEAQETWSADLISSNDVVLELLSRIAAHP